jgi:hypothetical protein
MIPHHPFRVLLRLLALGVVWGTLAHTLGVPPLRSAEREANNFAFNYSYWVWLRGNAERKQVIDIRERKQWVEVERAWKNLRDVVKEVE